MRWLNLLPFIARGVPIISRKIVDIRLIMPYPYASYLLHLFLYNFFFFFAGLNFDVLCINKILSTTHFLVCWRMSESSSLFFHSYLCTTMVTEEETCYKECCRIWFDAILALASFICMGVFLEAIISCSTKLATSSDDQGIRSFLLAVFVVLFLFFALLGTFRSASFTFKMMHNRSKVNPEIQINKEGADPVGKFLGV